MSNRFGALAEASFRRLWIGRTASAVGDAVMPVTLVFAVIFVGGSVRDIGLVLALSMGVRVALLVIGGTLADRLPRRLVMVGSDVCMAGVQAVVGVLLLLHRGTLPLLLGASVCYGIASAISKPALTGLVPQTVSTHRLQQANALMGLSRSTAQIIGPALGGAIAAVATPGWAYLLDALTFVVSAATLLGIVIAPQQPREQANFFRDIVVGWREMAARTWYWTALCCHAIWNLGSCVFPVLGPVIVTRAGGAASDWGLVSASMAVGSVLGGVVALRWRPRRPLVVGHLALTLTALQLGSLFGSATLVLVMAGAMVGSAGVTLINEFWTTAVQQLVPDEIMSRLNSYDWLVSMVVVPVGYALVGPLSESVGTPTTLQIAVALVLVPVGLVLLVPGVRRVRQTPDGTIFGLDGEGPPPEPALAAAASAAPQRG